MHHQAVGDVWLRMSQGVDDHSQPEAIIPVHPLSEQSVAPDKALPKDVHTPLAPEALEAYQRQLLAEGSSIAKVAKATHERFSQFCRAEASLLGHVDYPTTCGAFCRDPTITPDYITAMRDELVSCLTTMVKFLGGSKFLLEQECVLLVQPFRPDREFQLRFFTIGAQLAQSGPHQASQVLVESLLVGDPLHIGADMSKLEISGELQEDYFEGRGREACGGFQLVSASLCGNHRTNLVEASSFLYIDDCLHGDLFCATLFLATTGMFLRICLAAKVLAAEAEMKRCPAPSGPQEEFKVEFAQFLLDAKMSEWEHARLMPSASKAKRHKVEESEDGHAPPELDLREWHSRAKLGEPLDDIAKSADTRIHKAVVQYARLLIQFVCFFNGHWSSLVWQHHCLSPGCCRGSAGNYDTKAMRNSMSKLVLLLIFSSLPTTPQKGKWTKTWPCVTWFARALMPHSMLARLLHIAGLKQQTAPSQPTPQEDSIKSGMDIDFPAIKGMRRDRTSRFVNRCDTQHNVMFLCLLLEPLRYLCAWFMKSCNTTYEGKRRWPAAMDLASSASSPIDAMLRYYAALIRNVNSRCVLLWAGASASLEAWSGDSPHLHAKVRRGFLGISSWLYKRFKYWRLWPFPLLQTGDSRLGDATIAGVCQAFHKACPMCLDKGCGRRLKSKVNVQDMIKPQWRRAMMAWGHQVPASIGDVEHTHASNNVVGGEHNPTAGGFACRAFTKDCRLMAKAFQDWSRSQQTQVGGNTSCVLGPAGAPGTLLESLQSCKRALTPLDVFRKTKSVAGTLRGKVGINANTKLQEDFEKLSAAEQQEYHELASMTKEIGKRNRAASSVDGVKRPRVPASPALGDEQRSELQHGQGGPGPSAAPAPSEGAVVLCSPSHSMHHQAVGDVWLRMSQGVDDHSQPEAIIPVHPLSEQSVAPDKALPKDVHTPLAPEALEAYQRQLLAEGSSIAKVAKATHERFSQFCRAEASLLGHVDYPTTCGAFCRDPTITPDYITAMRDELVSCLTTMVKFLGGSKFLLEQECVLLVQPFRPDREFQLRFFTIGAQLAQSGPHQASQVLVESLLVGDPLHIGADMSKLEISGELQEDYFEGRGREACGGFQLVSASLCGNHRTNLVEASSFLYIDDCLHGDLFCATLFLATTGMFLRICLAAKVLAAEAEMKRCPAPSGPQEEFKVEFAQFLLDAKMSEWEHARLMPSASKAKRHKVEESEDGHAPPELDLREWHSRAKLGEPLDDIAKSADTRIHKAVVTLRCFAIHR